MNTITLVTEAVEIEPSKPDADGIRWRRFVPGDRRVEVLVDDDRWADVSEHVGWIAHLVTNEG